MTAERTSAVEGARALLGPGLIVVALEALLALALYFFLTSGNWIVTVGLLAAGGAGFVLLQRNPEIESRITDWFAQARVVAVAFGGLIAVVFPVFVGGD